MKKILLAVASFVSMLFFLSGCTTYSSTTAAQGSAAELTGFAGFLSKYSFLIIMVLFIAIMYFLLIRPQRKKEKKAKEMLGSLTVGDEVVTISGVVGRIVQVKDDGFIIESGVDRTKIRVKKWAIQEKVVPESN